MADAFKGLTIKIGADVRPLSNALNSVKSATSGAQRELNRLNKALKFDPNNAGVLINRLSMIDDKLKLAARSSNLMKTAISQTSSMTKTLANKTGEVFAAAQRTRDQYNGVTRELSTMYDAMAKFVQKEEKIDFNDALSQVKRLVREMDGIGKKATEARAAVKKIFTGMASGKANTLPFGLQNAEQAISSVERLRSEHVKLNYQLERLDEAQGFRTLVVQAAAVKSELMEAAMQAAKFRSELYSAGGSNVALNKTSHELRTMDGVLDVTRQKLHAMDEAYKSMPKSAAAASAKMRSTVQHVDSLNQAIAVLVERMRIIESTNGFDKQAVYAKNVVANVAKAEIAYAECKAELKEMSTAAELLTEKMQNLSAAEREAYMADPQYEDDERQLKKYEREVDKLRAKLSTLDEALEKANMEKEWVEARDAVIRYEAEIDKVKGKISKLTAVGNIGASIKNVGYAMYSTLTPTIMMAGRYAISSAEEVDSAYRDMRKTVQGTEEEFEALKDAAIEYGRTHVTSADQILSIEAIGGQLGITVDNLEAFATTVSNLDIATNMETEDIAADLGKMATVMGMNNEEYDHFADSLVRLGNSEPAFESDIMKITTRFMGMGKVVGMQPHQMLAWATAATATGQKAEAAGSSMLRFISNMETATNANEETMSAWAKVAGMSASEFKESFGKDASGTMYKFIEGLGKIQKSGGSVNQTLKELGLNNVRDKQLLEGLAQQMANATAENNVLADSLLMSYDAWYGINDIWGDAGDAAREASRKAEGFSGQLQIMKNNAQALAVELGEGAAPWIARLNVLITSISGALSSMSPASKEAIVAIMGIAASIGPLAVATGSIMTAASNIGNTLKTLPTAWLSLSKACDTAIGKMGKFSNVGNAASAAASAASVSSLGMAAAVLAVAAGIAAMGIMVYKGWKKNQEYIENVEKATHGLIGAEEEARKSVVEFGDKATDVYKETAESVRELVSKQAELADQFKQQWTTQYTNESKLEHYMSIIDELANKENLTSIEQAKLTQAVEGYNKIVGTQIEVIDAKNGKLADETGELIDNMSALNDNADAWKRNAEAKLYANQATKAMESYVEAEQDLYDARSAYRELNKQYEYMQEHRGMYNSDELNSQYKRVEQAAQRVKEAQEVLDSMSNTSDVFLARSAAIESGMRDWMDTLGSVTSKLEETEFNTTQLAGSLAELGLSQEDLSNYTTDQWDKIISSYDGSAESIAHTLAEMKGINKNTFDAMWFDCDGDLTKIMKLIDNFNAKDVKNKYAKINVDSSDVDSALSKIASLNAKNGAKVLIHAAVDYNKGATGTFTDFPITRAVPAHAAGGITGIVTQPTLTNWGLVGEAGAEALVRWAQGTAVVPLENHRYVRPFAQTIAQEMGHLNTGTTNVTNVYLNDVRVNDTPAIAAATEEYLGVLARYSAMGGAA